MHNFIRAFRLISSKSPPFSGSHLPTTQPTPFWSLISSSKNTAKFVYSSASSQTWASLDSAAQGRPRRICSDDAAFQVLEKYPTRRRRRRLMQMSYPPKKSIHNNPHHEHLQTPSSAPSIESIDPISPPVYSHLRSLYGCLPNSQTLSSCRPQGLP